MNTDTRRRVDAIIERNVKNSVNAAVQKALAAGGSGNPSPRTAARKTDTGVPFSALHPGAQAIIGAARAMTPAPHHKPSEAEIRAISGPGALDEVTRCKAVMQASRGPAKR
jgi:hypothetical protein